MMPAASSSFKLSSKMAAFSSPGISLISMVDSTTSPPSLLSLAILHPVLHYLSREFWLVCHQGTYCFQHVLILVKIRQINA
ncbi:Uncharacterised protein [Vibrio cholerae]|uniref:Uncharacterized protein n=1 Tax=Vibrio cholerae TaxID=666 RepID=A0A655NRJ1_VIBCL|nr:Uncharacterised protein [Vibrio cholerae]CRZ76124.1 Uncharacterised protein [Vibrio cholerae]CSA31972.1 Uncharacterised protein [Vibrio cholerae]CSB60775.1 Uncharacterised protein [Vibrio cholerae]CSC39919.1 Uncharacterised protein [Vibrio cholerae]